jgi:pyruvate formate lyase activating enzyme
MASAERELRVGGIAPYSSVDFPGRLCAVVFVQGCAWRCGYCHNPHLQPSGGGARLEWSRVRGFLERRRGLLDAVVFSGGEPTSDPGLERAVDEVRASGFAVGLHSAGIHPRRLARVLPHVDWVGLDVKAPFERYESVTAARGSGRAARASASMVIEQARDYELRTTFHPALLAEDEVLALAEDLARRGAKRYALQEFRATGCGDARLRTTHARASDALLGRLRALFPDFIHRRP